MERKQVVYIYLRADAPTTRTLIDFLDKNLDAINQYVTIHIQTVSPKNVREAKQRGITKIPTLLYGGNKIVSLERIIKFLTPPESNKDILGFGVGSPEELVQRYQDAVINDQSNDDDVEGDSEEFKRTLQQKMAAMQRRRPEMKGVDHAHKLTGGRKLKAAAQRKRAFDTDEEFIREGRLDNVEETPSVDMGGKDDYALEEYYNAEADKSGRKHKRSGRLCGHA